MANASGAADDGNKQSQTTSSESKQTTRNNSPSSSLSQSAIPTLRKQLSAGILSPDSTASTTSPRTSRNTSPLRKDVARSAAQAQAGTVIPRALSASNVPQLANTADGASRTPRLQRNTPNDTILTRLKTSPPRTETTTVPSISVQNTEQSALQSPRAVSAEKLALQSPRSVSADSKSELQTPKSTSRGPSGKSVLATVDENGSESQESLLAVQPLTKLAEESSSLTAESDAPGRSAAAAAAAESGSDSGGKSDGLTVQRSSQQSKRSNHSSSSSSSLLAKSRPEGNRNMTVETETVQSIPHSGLTTERTASSRTEAGGTVRMKSSNETIRPKKERRLPSRKARSVQGVASSKADLFEARVANAVDEANSSDSDETFVYESNPPEARRPRHHSRTPSVTSSHSTADINRGMRSLGDALDERRVAGKRSMKFSNNPFQSDDSPSDPNGTVRSHHARHYGRWGRGGSHASMFDPDSPFTQASKLRSNNHSLRHSRPNSPRNQARNGTAPIMGGKKRDSPFDFDVEGADDERTPLMGTVRTPRRSHIRVDSNDDESLQDYYDARRRRRRCSTLGSFLLGVLIFSMVVISTIGFLIASNRPLTSVHVRRIDNVLATGQELLLDLRVGAVNPNALSIAISEMDMTMVAKSKYKPNETEIDTNKASADPDDSEKEPLLTLGHVMHFDQALKYQGTPFQRRLQYSVGGLHLSQPGNRTGTDGSARWEKLLQHPFELILRGVFKYKLPISARDESVEVTASVIVHPEDGVDAAGRMRLEPVDHSEHWQWIDWEREKDILGSISDIETGAFE